MKVQQIFFEQCYCKGRFWLLSPKDQWIQVQRAQYKEFVESEFKSYDSMDQTTHTVNQEPKKVKENKLSP